MSEKQQKYVIDKEQSFSTTPSPLETDKNFIVKLHDRKTYTETYHSFPGSDVVVAINENIADEISEIKCNFNQLFKNVDLSGALNITYTLFERDVLDYNESSNIIIVIRVNEYGDNAMSIFYNVELKKIKTDIHIDMICEQLRAKYSARTKKHYFRIPVTDDIYNMDTIKNSKDINRLASELFDIYEENKGYQNHCFTSGQALENILKSLMEENVAVNYQHIGMLRACSLILKDFFEKEIA